MRTKRSLSSHKVDYRRDNSCDNDPHQLEPVEKWDAEQSWLCEIIKWRPEQDDEGDNEQKKKGSAASPPGRARRTINHRADSLC